MLALENLVSDSDNKIAWSELKRLRYEKESELIEEDVKKLKQEIKRLE
jgi:hypothetical protein